MRSNEEGPRCLRCVNYWLMLIPDENGELLGKDPMCDAGHDDIVAGDPALVENCSDFKESLINKFLHKPLMKVGEHGK